MKLFEIIPLAAVSIILIATMLIPAINLTSSDNPDEWEYDDYRDADGVSSASGSVELITIGDAEYLHAKDLGEGNITYTNGTSKTVDVKKANLDMLFIMGQSNGEYLTQYADPTTASPVPELGEAYYYGTTTAPTIKEYDSSECAMRSMLNSDGELIVGDIWPSLAAEYTENTGIKSFVVSAAWGGKSITEFTPGTGAIWLYSVQVLADAISAVDTTYYNLSVKNYIWIQGEADENMVKNEYINRFAAMNEAIMDGDLGVDTINACFISKVRTERAPVIAEAETEICETIPNVYMACELADGFTYDNGYRADYSHYTQAGDNLIGEALGEYIANHYYPINQTMNIVHDIAMIIPVIIIAAMIIVMVFALRSRE